jgi:hypothetical protein
MPILLILPPRRFNAIMALQVGMFGFGANELLEYRTGQGLLWWAGKPIRWTMGSDDSEAENQKIQERLRRRREKKEEEVKRRIEEEGDVVGEMKDIVVNQARGAQRTIGASLKSSSRAGKSWTGREG